MVYRLKKLVTKAKISVMVLVWMALLMVDEDDALLTQCRWWERAG